MNKVKKKQKYNTFQNTDWTTFFGQTYNTFIKNSATKTLSLKLNRCTNFKEPVQELFAVQLNNIK